MFLVLCLRSLCFSSKALCSNSLNIAPNFFILSSLKPPKDCSANVQKKVPESVIMSPVGMLVSGFSVNFCFRFGQLE